jgi:hypothetical protein
MKNKRWIILICIVVVLVWIVAWLYYYSCTETSTQCAECFDEDCTPCPEPERYCSFYNIPYKLWLKNTLNEKLDGEYKEDYESWKETCEYVNTHYQCWWYDCSKKWYKKNYNLCWDEFTSITE